MSLSDTQHFVHGQCPTLHIYFFTHLTSVDVNSQFILKLKGETVYPLYL